MRKIILLFFVISSSLFSQEYKIPPDVIKSLIDANPQPSLNLNNNGTFGLILNRDGYQSIDELAKDELRIAGKRLDPLRYTSSRMTYYKSFSLIDILSESEIIVQYPENGKFSNFSWSPDEKKIAFTNTTNSGVELWVLDIDLKKSYKISDIIINNINVKPFQWFNSNTEILVSLKCDDIKPVISKIPSGPIIQETNNQNAPSRTYQDLIKNKNDEILFEHYSCISLQKISLLTNSRDQIVKGMIKEYDLSPDQEFLLTKTINKPFSYLVPYYRFPYRVDLVDLSSGSIKMISDIPIDEVRPTGFDATRLGIRSVSWRNDKGSELYWVEANDGGDPKNDVEYRDIVYTLSKPFTSKKKELTKTKLRFRNIRWSDSEYAIISERLWKMPSF